ncbi:MAG: hypothetical protein QF441_16395 [Bacteriovoracaceae bacterium]|jgi:hypothetical protein|nr:hypothetical protein [Halobacteriovoraceae bacterium]MDP7322185.1 hypothetical protein [Bacteriovoracaceae bacterium]
MSNIINKSNHPVEVKKIQVKVWKLRDEIEAAIAQRLTEHQDSNTEVNIDDIKNYYTSLLNGDLQEESTDSENEDSAADANLDSSGNPLDDDAMAMMAALGGDQEEENSEDQKDQASPEQDSDEAQLQNQDSETQESANEEDDEAAMLAAQMLADQAAPAEAEQENAAQDVPQKPFKRVMPDESKITHGFMLLSDIQMDQVMIFCQQGFIYGQNIIIEFVIPSSFYLLAEVTASSNIGRKSRIISQTKPEFRVQAKFLHKFPNERSQLRNFLTSIEPEIPDPPKKLKRPTNEDEDDDDFDDLGF